jgi:hypothetical protein
VHGSFDHLVGAQQYAINSSALERSPKFHSVAPPPDGFFDSRLNMPRGHCGFAVCLIRERNERPATLVGDVEAPTFCQLATVPIFHMGHPPKSITLVVAGASGLLTLTQSGDRPDR